MKLVSVAEMVAIEKQANENGLSYARMMENAGHGLAEVILETFPLPLEEEPFAFGLVGSGNNGGDTLVALTHLAEHGWQACAYLVRRKPDELVERLQAAGGEVIHLDDDVTFDALTECLETADVLLDGLLGTGVRLPLRETVEAVLWKVKTVLEEMEAPPFLVAVDCPSGVDSDTGAAAEACLPADLTVTMAAVKQGLLRFPAYRYVGDLQVVDIGLPPDLPALQAVLREVADEQMVRAFLPPRPDDAHKGTFGTALVVAGSVNYTGAALLAGKAAYRVGAGLVQMAVPTPLHTPLAGQFPEATWVLLPHELGVISEDAADVLAEHFEKADAVLIGPGFGREATTRRFWEALLQGKRNAPRSPGIGFVHAENDAAENTESTKKLPPLVVDADGLKLLSEITGWEKQLPRESVLTPHPGEMAVLTGLSKDEIQADREATAARFAAEWGQVVVLKGAFTVIAAPDGRLAVIPVATSALARAGTGDVLAGMIAGLRAQGVPAWEAAVAGAWLHAAAGLYAADWLGQTASVLASDVLAALPDVLADLL